VYSPKARFYVIIVRLLIKSWLHKCSPNWLVCCYNFNADIVSNHLLIFVLVFAHCGSDFPFVTTECGYTNAWHVLPPANSNEAFFSEKEVKACMGGTAVSLFKGGWKNHSSGL
jgi:hypothetical protein